MEAPLKESLSFLVHCCWHKDFFWLRYVCLCSYKPKLSSPEQYPPFDMCNKYYLSDMFGRVAVAVNAQALIHWPDRDCFHSVIRCRSSSSARQENSFRVVQKASIVFCSLQNPHTISVPCILNCYVSTYNSKVTEWDHSLHPKETGICNYFAFFESFERKTLTT